MFNVILSWLAIGGRRKWFNEWYSKGWDAGYIEGMLDGLRIRRRE